MGEQKKEKNRLSKAKAGGSERITKPLKGENFYRDAKKVKRLNMLRGGKPIRNSSGKIIKAAEHQGTLASGTQSRIQPDRRWFGNTRTIGQQQLDKFREAMKEKANNPFEILLHRQKLPLSLLVDSAKTSKMHLLESESFDSIFGGKTQRKRPKLSFNSLDELANHATDKSESYDPSKDSNLFVTENYSGVTREWYEKAGQSKRIWNELYKVIDSSDIVIHVLDSRNPNGTRCRDVEKYIRKEASHKHLIFVLNKCDLVPTWVTVSSFICHCFLVTRAWLHELVRCNSFGTKTRYSVEVTPLLSW